MFVGANNCGKTQLLKDMLTYIVGSRENRILLNEMDIEYPDTPEELIGTHRDSETKFSMDGKLDIPVAMKQEIKNEVFGENRVLLKYFRLNPIKLM